MTKPRLLILSFSNIAADARVLKQVEYFAGEYDVTTYGYGTSPDPRVHHVQLDEVHDLRKWTRQELIARRFKRMYWNQAGIQQGLNDLSNGERFDVILANDLDSVGLALALEPAHGVHADLHEYAPRQNEELLVWRLFVAPYVRWMCRTFLTKVASATTVGQGIADEYKRRYGAQLGVVTNATPFADLNPGTVTSPIRLVHSGASLPNRRLEMLVDAAVATSTDLTLDLYLMGNDPGYIAMLRDRAGDSPRVRFLDPVPYSELIATLNAYDVGIHVMAPTNFNNYWALPNKFFDYVQARLGLIVGPSPEMQRLVESHQVGAVTQAFTAEALTTVLDALTVEGVRAWKARAAASAHELSSENQVRVWADAIAKLVGTEHP